MVSLSITPTSPSSPPPISPHTVHRCSDASNRTLQYPESTAVWLFHTEHVHSTSSHLCCSWCSEDSIWGHRTGCNVPQEVTNLCNRKLSHQEGLLTPYNNQTMKKRVVAFINDPVAHSKITKTPSPLPIPHPSWIFGTFVNGLPSYLCFLFPLIEPLQYHNNM